MNDNEYDVFIMSFYGRGGNKYYYIFMLNENLPTETIDQNRTVGLIVYCHFGNEGM